MVSLPEHEEKLYLAFLSRSGVPVAISGYYLKWLRYYLDFCSRHPVSGPDTERLRLFLEKLRDKNQTRSADGRPLMRSGFIS